MTTKKTAKKKITAKKKVTERKTAKKKITAKKKVTEKNSISEIMNTLASLPAETAQLIVNGADNLRKKQKHPIFNLTEKELNSLIEEYRGLRNINLKTEVEVKANFTVYLYEENLELGIDDYRADSDILLNIEKAIESSRDISIIRFRKRLDKFKQKILKVAKKLDISEEEAQRKIIAMANGYDYC